MLPKRDRQLKIETLESRQLLAVTTVDSHLDVVDSTDGLTSLREAIAASNADIDADEIRFAPSLAGETIRLTEGDLRITSELSIIGPGADLLTIDASGNDPTPGTNNGDGSRIFTIGDGNPDFAPQVTLAGLTLTGGDVDGHGGAIWAERFGYESFATGTITFPDQQLTGSGSVDFTIEQRESTGTLELLAGSIEITSTANGAAAGGLGIAAGGVNVVLYDTDDDSNAISAAYNAGLNQIEVHADLSGIDGISQLRIVDLADEIARIETSAGTRDFTISTVRNPANFLTVADAKTHVDVLTGGSDQSTETIYITATPGAASNVDIHFVEQAGVGATPKISGNAIKGYTVAIDSQGATTVAAIAVAVQNIAEVATATYAGNATFNGSLDNVPAAITSITGGRDAGADVITVTATTSGPEFNRTLSFNTLNANIGEVSVTDDGFGIVVSIDGNSQYALQDIADAISNDLYGYSASVTGDGSGTYDADNLNDNLAPILSNVDGGLDPVEFPTLGAVPTPLILSQVHISDNHAQGQGGGVYSEGAIRLESSTVSGNLVTVGDRGVAYGGGVAAHEFVDVQNSTISGNEAVNQWATGGGVFSLSKIQIAHSTITNNRVTGRFARGGGVSVRGFPSADLSITHTIVAGNTASDRQQNVTFNGPLDINYSLLGDAAGLTLSGTSIQIGVDPMLGPLTDNGGPTPTHSLQECSPAIDAGDPAYRADRQGVPEFDQRGDGSPPFHRVSYGRIDLGAVESPGINGDYNEDRRQNGTDFLLWQRGYGEQYTSADLAVWQTEYSTYALTNTCRPEIAVVDESLASLSVAHASLSAHLGFDHEYSALVGGTTIPANGNSFAELPNSAGHSVQALIPPAGKELRQTLEDTRSVVADELPWLTEELLERVFG